MSVVLVVRLGSVQCPLAEADDCLVCITLPWSSAAASALVTVVSQWPGLGCPHTRAHTLSTTTLHHLSHATNNINNNKTYLHKQTPIDNSLLLTGHVPDVGLVFYQDSCLLHRLKTINSLLQTRTCNQVSLSDIFLCNFDISDLVLQLSEE